MFCMFWHKQLGNHFAITAKHFKIEAFTGCGNGKMENRKKARFDEFVDLKTTTNPNEQIAR